LREELHMNAPAADRVTATPSAAAVDHHPLRRLTAEEIQEARRVLAEADLLTPTTRFAYLGLEEPTKDEVLAWSPGDVVERRVRAVLLDVATGQTTDTVVTLTEHEVESATEIDCASAGQPPILLEEFILVDEIVKGDEGWRAAMARRGVEDLDLVRPCPLSAGVFDIAGEEGRRLLRVLSFLQHRPEDHCWAHPIDGVVAYVDLIEKRVVELIDDQVLPIPAEEGNFDDPAYVGPERTTLKPLEITQPEGPSFTVEGDEVTWEKWRFRCRPS
jgi:primary-amine oxidase